MKQTFIVEIETDSQVCIMAEDLEVELVESYEEEYEGVKINVSERVGK